MRDVLRLSRYSLGLIGLAVLVAGLPVAQPAMAQESVAVRADLVKGALPAEDPTAAAWNTAPRSEFPLSPQVHWPTRIGEVTVKSVTVRALHDGRHLAILLEYADPSKDPHDAAAMWSMTSRSNPASSSTSRLRSGMERSWRAAI